MAPSRSEKVRFILASASPRRTELLNLVGIEHEVLPADVDEKTDVPAEPGPHVLALAERKALWAARRRPGALVLGADTIVYHHGEILGKPKDESQAREMISRLAGAGHEVYTGIALAGYPDEGSPLSTYEVTGVRFRRLTAQETAAYAATGEPLDKAGAYGIQGFGATIVESISGCYFNVMGLPLTRLVSLLKDRGLSYMFGPVTTGNEK